jgi:hypothetical protein
VARHPAVSWAQENRFAFLVFSLLLLILVSPFFAGELAVTAISAATFLVLVSAAYAAAATRRETRISTLLFLPALGGFLANTFGVDTPVRILILPFLAWVIATIFRHVRRSRVVTAETLFGALGVYFLLGFLWSNLYEMVEAVLPGSFSGIDGSPGEFLYFSFVTLTTLGYGDVLPLGDHARSLVVLEATTGVIYMAVMIGGLVGLYISTPHETDDD